MTFDTQKIVKYSVWTIGLGVVAFIAAGLGVLAVVWGMVMFGDDSHLSESTVKARIIEETSILMNDETTQIGSFFASGHRRYVPIDEVPAHMINAIIAAEDKNFYNHVGVDPMAIGSAVYGVLRGGRMRGASGLTQQTVKNILGDWEFSLRRKFREAIGALQLERIYSKRQILEFYLNQFYVSGNGNGIGIAARYYFNKDVRDLDLVESAFIAGSVKGPSAYDPFIKFTKEARERAIKHAFVRKNYVLKRMYEQSWINEEEFNEAFAKPVKFVRGRFRTTEVALIELVKAQVKRKEILEELNMESVHQLNQAGLKIFTTIDPVLQERAQLAMRRNLSRLDSILMGFKSERPERFVKLRSLVPNDFYYAKVVEIVGPKDKPEIKVSFGLPQGVIPFESVMRYAKLLDLPYGRGYKQAQDKLIKSIKPGDVLFVEVLEYDSETHEAVAEMRKRPRVNGGMVVLDKGEVRAVVSGFDTKGFNRAMSAKRQPGSVFKPMVFFGALQLGWNMLDRLDNQRQVFPYQGQFYFPRGDHISPYESTSMLWAGIMSENLASVYLANHIVDKLNLNQFQGLMKHMGLGPNEGESERDYHYRVARAVGVQLDHAGVREYQLRNSINDLMLDVAYTSTQAMQSKLKKMWWGRGYAAEMKATCLLDSNEISNSRKAMRWNLLQNNFLRFGQLNAQAEEDWKIMQTKVEEIGYESAFVDPSVQHIISRFKKVQGYNKPVLGYFSELDIEKPGPKCTDYQDIMRNSEIIYAQEKRVALPLSTMDMQAVWDSSSMFGADVKFTDVVLDGWLSTQDYSNLKLYVDRHFNEVTSRQSDYDVHRYYQHHDFRIGLGLLYLVNFAKAMGVTSNLEPVQSFPLGTNDVTVAEVAKIYQTLISGKTYKFYKEGTENQANFIRRIEDRYGNTLFEPERKEFQLVNKSFALQMREILRLIITNGTGRRARGELFVDLNENKKGLNDKLAARTNKIRIPSFGKTGTTNDYTNAYFAGFVPYPTEKNAPLDPENSYVISSYVGYDLNKTMRAGYLRISGAQGALPVWIGMAKAAIEGKEYAEMLDTFDLSILARREWPLKKDESTRPMHIDMPRGTLISSQAAEELYSLTDLDEEGEQREREHVLGAIRGTVYMPIKNGKPVRMFDPFKHHAKEDELELPGPEIEPSEIDDAEADGSISVPDISGVESRSNDQQEPSGVRPSSNSGASNSLPQEKPVVVNPVDPEEDLFGDLNDEPADQDDTEDEAPEPPQGERGEGGIW